MLTKPYPIATRAPDPITGRQPESLKTLLGLPDVRPDSRPNSLSLLRLGAHLTFTIEIAPDHRPNTSRRSVSVGQLIARLLPVHVAATMSGYPGPSKPRRRVGRPRTIQVPVRD
ncbi:hypothetical protein NL676_007721 [Syzygium grande]|nr:hypothetical protein NL676_007721 [Syzygium grande]